MRSLFPYFGAKSRAAPLVWEHLGDPECYIEPFGGSLAVLLARPTSTPRVEIAGDLDGLLMNFWRCIVTDWREMLPHFSGIVAEADLYAKHAALINARASLTDKLMADDGYYDPRLAAWWWEGISAFLGSGFGHRLAKQRPHIDRSLKGVWATSMTDERIDQVAHRLGNVMLIAGDWKRSCTDAILNRFDRGTGVFLDPPYSGKRQPGLYVEDAHLRDQVVEWCLRPHHSKVSIVLAGYDNEYPELRAAGWDVRVWKAPNGYAQESNDRRKAEALYVRVRKRVVRRMLTSPCIS
jgi:site-specific DNA-adenine methylase